MPSNEEITQHHFDEPPAGESPWVEGQAAPPYEIRVVEYDERWPGDFERVAGVIRDALGDRGEPDEWSAADEVADVFCVLHTSQHPSKPAADRHRAELPLTAST